MIFLSSLHINDFEKGNEHDHNEDYSRKELFNLIIDKYIQLCWFDLETLKKIKTYYILNELNIELNSTDVRKIEIGKIIHNFKKTNGFFRRLKPNQIQYVIEVVRNTEVISKSAWSTDNFIQKFTNEDIYFISNTSGQYLLNLIVGLDSEKLHPLQYSFKNYNFKELIDKNSYINLLKTTLIEKESSRKIGTFAERAFTTVEMIGRENWSDLNETTENDKIYLAGGDNYIIEEVIRYLIKDKMYNFYWDFRDGIPELEKSFDSLVLFNIDHLPVSAQSTFWLRVRDYNYNDKLIIITAKNTKFKFSSPIDFKQIPIPTLLSLKDDLLRFLTMLINRRTPKHNLWRVPKNYYEHTFLQLLEGLGELTEMDKVLEKMELGKYKEHLFSVDFWYDFIKIKTDFTRNDSPMSSHIISSYLLPLSEKEFDKIASYGRKYRFSRNTDDSFIIDTPGGKTIDIRKSIALEYIYYLIKNKFEYPNSIEIGDLFEAVNGCEYTGDRDTLLNTVRNSFTYLFNKQKPELRDLKDCFTLSEKGCFFEQKGNIRLKIRAH